MDFIVDFFANIGISFDSFWKAALIVLAGTLVFSLFGRFVFGKRSALSTAVSSVFGILFIYAVSVVLRSSGSQFNELIAPLPLVNISGDELILFSFANAHYTTICSEILSMIVLAFLMNLADGWLPRGKNMFSWIFFRCLTVLIAYILHLIVVGLFAAYIPQEAAVYAPVILLGLLILMLMTGALKLVIGLLISTVNPIIGGLYTFFFATIVGKQITKAVLTTALLCGLVMALRHIGIFTISIAAAALVAYVPIMILLVVLWFVACKLF